MSHFRTVVQNRFLVVTTASALLINAGLWWFSLYRQRPEEHAVPLHYNIYFGIDLLGPSWYIFFLPAAGLMIILVNIVLTMVLFPREHSVIYFLGIASLVLQIFLLLLLYLISTQLL